MKKLLPILLSLTLLCSCAAPKDAPLPTQEPSDEIILVEETSPIPTASPAPSNEASSSETASLFFPDDEILPSGMSVRLAVIPENVEFYGTMYGSGSYSIDGVFENELELSISRNNIAITESDIKDVMFGRGVPPFDNIEIAQDEEYSTALGRPTYRVDCGGRKAVFILTEEYTFIIEANNLTGNEDLAYLQDAWLSGASLCDSFWWPRIEETSEPVTGAGPSGIPGIFVSYNTAAMEGWTENEPDLETDTVFFLSHDTLGNISVNTIPAVGSGEAIVIAQQMMDDISENYSMAFVFGPYDFNLESGLSGVYFTVQAGDSDYSCVEHHYITLVSGIAFDIMLDADLEVSEDAINDFAGIFLDKNFDITVN